MKTIKLLVFSIVMMTLSTYAEQQTVKSPLCPRLSTKYQTDQYNEAVSDFRDKIQNIRKTSKINVASTLLQSVLHNFILTQHVGFELLDVNQKQNMIKKILGDDNYKYLQHTCLEKLGSKSTSEVKAALDILGSCLFNSQSKHKIREVFWCHSELDIKLQAAINLIYLDDQSSLDLVKLFLLSLESEKSLLLLSCTSKSFIIDIKQASILRCIRVSNKGSLINLNNYLSIDKPRSSVEVIRSEFSNFIRLKKIMESINEDTEWNNMLSNISQNKLNQNSVEKYKSFIYSLIKGIKLNYHFFGKDYPLLRKLKKLIRCNNVNLQKNILDLYSLYYTPGELLAMITSDLPNRKRLLEFYTEYYKVDNK